MLEGLVEELARDGHEVTVLCASGGYAGKERGIHSALPSSHQPSTLNLQHLPSIIRLRTSRFGRGTFIGKLLDYASYYVGVAWKLLTLHPAPDRIVALTTPPLLSVLARLLSKIRGADHAHWVMDLYPDVMAAHGMLGKNNVMYRVLAGLSRWGFGGRRCAAVLTLGPDMAERVKKVISHQRSEITKEEEGNEDIAAPYYSQPFIPAKPRGDAGSTLNSQFSLVQWVPLWGTAGEREKLTTEELKAEMDSPSTINSPPTTSSLRHQRGWGDGELIVMYSGNMGLGHRFGEILAAAHLADLKHRSDEGADSMHFSRRGMNESRDESRGPGLPTTDSSNYQPSTLHHQHSTSMRFVFYGDGKRRVEVEAFVRENPECAVELHGYAPAAELAAHLQSADVHLATLDAAWTGTMVPSKLQGIFAVGRPVIFIGSADSSIGQWVAESGGGWVVPAGDVDGLLAALDEARDPEIRLIRGRAAEVYARSHFDKRTNVARVAAILAGEGTPRPSAHGQGIHAPHHPHAIP